MKHWDPESVKSAFGVLSGIGRTLLPAEPAIPEADLAHWHRAAEVERDGREHEEAFEADYQAWLKAGAPTGADWRDGA